MTVYVYDDLSERMVPKEELLRRRSNDLPKRNWDLSCPSVISDTMDPVQSQLDGDMYDSKSKLRRTYREGGVEEVGNDPAYTDPEKMKFYVPPKPDIEAVRNAVRRGLSLANLTTSSPGDEVRIKDWQPPNPDAPVKLHGGVKE